MSFIHARVRRALTHAAGFIALALVLAVLGAFIAHDGRGAQRFGYALLTLGLAAATARLLSWAARRSAATLAQVLSLRTARYVVVATAPLAAGFALFTLIAASDPLPGLLVFLAGLAWLLAGPERPRSRAGRLAARLTTAWQRKANAVALATRLGAVGVGGNLTLLLLWLG